MAAGSLHDVQIPHRSGNLLLRIAEINIFASSTFVQVVRELLVAILNFKILRVPSKHLNEVNGIAGASRIADIDILSPGTVVKIYIFIKPSGGREFCP